ncbi:cytochrome ubiquinol oxidase subunit I [Mycolicibacterium litorale]|uniref:cytochrome ubiquinol oxidase subunit I n=1 Tax=Mycolicibacterium litorale TaxID=758802 RepID=UPI0039A16F5E
MLIDGKVEWALTIPRLGSIIARNSWDAPVPGLNEIPRNQWPPVNITHLAFQAMVGIGTLLVVVAAVYWVARWRGRDLLGNRWFLWLAVAVGPLAVVALESGWVATEVGRQPWTVYGVLRTVDAASESSGLWWSYIAVLVIYLGMTVGAVVVLRSMARRWRAGETDLPSPYGPPRTESVP